MGGSIVVVGAALSADVDAPTERVHSAPGARRVQSPKQPTGERAGRENTEEFRVGSHGDSGNSPDGGVGDRGTVVAAWHALDDVRVG